MRGIVGVSLVFVAAVLGFGCGGSTPPPRDLKGGGASKSDQDQVKEALVKAGIMGEVIALQDGGDYWQVSVQDVPPPAEAGKGGIPKPGGIAPPATYRVVKRDLSVLDHFTGKPLQKK